MYDAGKRIALGKIWNRTRREERIKKTTLPAILLLPVT
jgi:hypothetical protein